MKRFYHELPIEQKQRKRHLLRQERDGGLDNEVLDYFVWIWLEDMGYGTANNRKYLQRMVRLELGEVAVYKFLKFY
jgi:hypothetical protein